MRLIPILTLALALAAFGAACQNQTGGTAANSNANANTAAATTDHSGHDMSNMKGHDMSNMNASTGGAHDHGNEMTSAPGAADQPYDLQFIDSMIHHHEGALQMAKMVLGKTERQEVKTFAQKISDDQAKEMEQMRRWRDEWFAGKPAALNMELPGMKGGTEMMNSAHMKDMDEMDPAHFDGHFLSMMIKHHEGAVEMAKDAQRRAERPEIKQIAQEIVREQEAEIRQMRAWKAKWKE